MRTRPWNALALLAAGLLTMTGGNGGCCEDSTVKPLCEGTVEITAPADDACILVNTPVTLSANITWPEAVGRQLWNVSGGTDSPPVDQNPSSVTFTSTGDFTISFGGELLGENCEGGGVAAEITVHVRDDCSPPEPTIELGVFASPVPEPDGVSVFSAADWAAPALTYGVGISGSTGSVVIDPASRKTIHPFVNGTARYGNLAVKGVAKSRSGTVPSAAFVEFGAAGALLHPWYDMDGNWSGSQGLTLGTSALDAAIHTDWRGGFTVTTPGYVSILEWNGTTGFDSPGGDIPSSDFPGLSGGLVSSQARGGTGPVLVLADGSPGQLYLHDRTPGHTATSLGPVGMTPRRVRMVGGVFAVTAQGSDSLFVGTWDGSDNVALTDGTAVGDGPVGVDLVDLEDGTVAAVTTGFNDNTYTVTAINATTGAIVSSTTTAAPAEILNPAHAAFLDTDHKIIMTGYGSDNYAIVASGL